MPTTSDESPFWAFPSPTPRMPVLAANVVAASQPLAAEAGLAMLRQGGNAVDAALAAAIALTVVEPTSNGVGGDAFALLWDQGRLAGFNGSGRSPVSWSPERFRGHSTMPERGWDAVTVPGAVDCWAQLSQRFGRLHFAELFAPAIGYAEEGFLVSPITAAAWARAAAVHGPSADFAAAFLVGGRAPRPGERFRCPALARTLAEIAESRGESFYRGPLAQKIAAHASAGGGALSLADLQAHRGEWVTPLAQDYGGVRLHELPPNGQGLAALIALGILGRLERPEPTPDCPASIHRQAEAMKLALGEARRHVADPAWMTVSPAALLEEAFLAELAEHVRPDRAEEALGGPPAGGGTVCLAAADARGMMVSLIQSNFHGFGSGIVVPGTGISLQNRGAGFTLEPGHPNQVAGSKRPYHTIIPGFVSRGGEPLVAFGLMGGAMQPQGHLQLMVRMFEYGANPQVACDAPRWQLLADGRLALERGFDPTVAQELERLGHRVLSPAPAVQFGGAQLVHKLTDGYLAASDWRKDGQAVGF